MRGLVDKRNLGGGGVVLEYSCVQAGAKCQCGQKLTAFSLSSFPLKPTY